MSKSNPDYGLLPTVNTPSGPILMNDKQRRKAAVYVLAEFIDEPETAREIWEALGLVENE